MWVIKSFVLLFPKKQDHVPSNCEIDRKFTQIVCVSLMHPSSQHVSVLASTLFFPNVLARVVWTEFEALKHFAWKCSSFLCQYNTKQKNHLLPFVYTVIAVIDTFSLFMASHYLLFVELVLLCSFLPYFL